MVDTFLSFFRWHFSPLLLVLVPQVVVFLRWREGKPRWEKRPPPTVRTRETWRERERKKAAATTKRVRGGAATTTQEKEREGKSHRNAREVERRRCHHHQKEGTGGYPSLVVASLSLPLHGGYLLSHCFVAGFLSLLLSHFYGCSFRSFLRGSSSPLSVCGCPSRPLFLPWLRSSLFFFAVVLPFLSFFVVVFVVFFV